MNTFRCCGVQLCVLVIFLAIAVSSDCKEPKRSKISSDFGLTPFLRSGRGYDRTWDLNTDVKRRIGKMVSASRPVRTDPDSDKGVKRPPTPVGMWFGPRLGRVQKRNIDEFTPWTYIILNGEGPVSRQVHYTPRLGRESEEAYDEIIDSEADSA